MCEIFLCAFNTAKVVQSTKNYVKKKYSDNNKSDRTQATPEQFTHKYIQGGLQTVVILFDFHSIFTVTYFDIALSVFSMSTQSQGLRYVQKKETKLFHHCNNNNRIEIPGINYIQKKRKRAKHLKHREMRKVPCNRVCWSRFSFSIWHGGKKSIVFCSNAIHTNFQ